MTFRICTQKPLWPCHVFDEVKKEQCNYHDVGPKKITPAPFLSFYSQKSNVELSCCKVIRIKKENHAVRLFHTNIESSYLKECGLGPEIKRKDIQKLFELIIFRSFLH